MPVWILRCATCAPKGTWTCYTQVLKSLTNVMSPDCSSPEIAVVCVRLDVSFMHCSWVPSSDYRTFRCCYKPHYFPLSTVTKSDDTVCSSVRAWRSCLFTSKAQTKSMSLSFHIPGCKPHTSTFTLQWQYEVALNKVGIQPHYCPKGLSYTRTRLPESKVSGTGSEQSVIPWHCGFFPA